METRNTITNPNRLTPCPTCGAGCLAVIDLDDVDRCNDCRGLDAKTLKIRKSVNTSGKKLGNPNFVKGMSQPAHLAAHKDNPSRKERFKRTRTIRNMTMQVIEHYMGKVYDDLDLMKPFYRWTILTKLMGFVMSAPKHEDELKDAASTAKHIIEVVYGAGNVDLDVNAPVAEVKIIGEGYGTVPHDTDEELYTDDDDEADDAEYISLD